MTPVRAVDIGSRPADDGFMGRALLVATLLVTSSPAASAQALSTLHITVTLADATGKITPVARHALLISDEPPSTAPRRIFTTLGRHGRRLAASRALCRGVRSAGGVRGQKLRMVAAH